MGTKFISFFRMFIIVNFLFLSCNFERKPVQKEPLFNINIRQIIDQNQKGQEFFLSDLGSSIRYVPLESHPACFLNFIHKVQIYQGNIFVSDRKGVFQFDSSGRFVREIGRIGRGPGEHTGRIRFAINPYRKEVYIYSFPTKMINVYQILTGEFLYSFSFDYYVSDFYFNDRNQIVFFTEEGTRYDLNFSFSENEAYLVENEILIDSILNPLRFEKMSNIAGHVLLYQNKNNAFYSFNYSDTLFQLDQDFNRKAYAVFNLGNKISHLNLKIESSFIGIQYPDFLYIDNVLEDSQFFFLNIGKGFAVGVELDIRNILFSKKEGEGWLAKKAINDLDEGLPFWPRWVVDGALINYFHPHEIIDFFNETKGKITHGSTFVRLATSLKETDNPVLVIVE